THSRTPSIKRGMSAPLVWNPSCSGETVMPATADDIGLSFAIMSLVFAGAALIRRWSRPLRELFIPTAVIGGFLMLGLGPEGLGRLTGGYGLFSDTTFAVWKVLPGLLINVMC